MNSNSPQKQIDNVLEIIKAQKSKLNRFEIHFRTTEIGLNIELSTLETILEKLVRDKYVYIDILFSEMVYYKVTFEGNLFIGYEKKRILDDENISRISQIETNEMKYKVRLFWATLSAGIFAGFLVLWQIWIWFYPVHSNYPYWIWETIPKYTK